ncbi:MAG: hypothetical protein KatS3mg077_1879 [Candidatus Binatia bacterium]|nr:MAG: hypothetical protein KatS3mg077_1879 [Candidatus Binatia bacterium]
MAGRIIQLVGRKNAASFHRHGLVAAPAQVISSELPRTQQIALASGDPDPALTEEDYARALACRARLPYTDLTTMRLDLALANVIKRTFALRYACAPFENHSSWLSVAAAYPLDGDALRLLHFAAGRAVSLAIAPQADVRVAQIRLYDSEKILGTYMAQVNEPAEVKVSEPSVALATPSTDAKLPPVVAQILASVAVDGFARRAHAVELTVGSGITTVYHLQGSDWKPAFSWPGWVGSLLCSWCRFAGGTTSDQQLRVQWRAQTILLRWQVAAANLSLQIHPVVPPATRPAPARPALTGFACPHCGTTTLHQSTLCPQCRMPLWRLCRRCGGRMHASQHACPCCGAAATPAPAATAAVPLAPTGSSLRNRPVGAPPTPLHILVVDDQPDVRLCLTSALQRLPVRIAAAGGGEEALQMIEQNPPHLIVLDLVMPGLDGFAVAERLRAALRTTFIPILAVTVLDPFDTRVQQALGPDDMCLQKPFARHHFLQRVLRMIRLNYALQLEGSHNGRPETTL